MLMTIILISIKTETIKAVTTTPVKTPFTTHQRYPNNNKTTDIDKQDQQKTHRPSMNARHPPQ